MQRFLISVEVMCNEKVMLLHEDEMIRLLRNYLSSQAYDSDEFTVKVVKKE